MRGFAVLALAAAALWTTTARAASHAHMVEAFAEKEFDRSAPVWIAPVSDKQAADPNFKIISTTLAEVLTANGFKIAHEHSTMAAVSIEYFAGSSGAGVSSSSTVYDPSYRMVLITGYDLSHVGDPKIVWQTMMDEYGISNDVRTTIPGLVRAAGAYLGASKTQRNATAASWCAHRPNAAGSHIPVVCSAATARPKINMAGYYNSPMASEPLPGVTPH